MQSTSSAGSSNTMKVELKTSSSCGFQQKDFDIKYGRIDEPPPMTLQSRLVKFWKGLRSTKACSSRTRLLDILPILRTIRSYRLKDYVLGDIVAGLSVAVMVIPQSLGFALMASVPPIMGLYTSIYPPLLYFIFGTAPYAGIGVMPLSSLIIGEVVNKRTAHLQTALMNDSVNGTAELEDQLHQEQMAIALTLTFISGMVALVMSALKLGFITSYLGSAYMSGFLTGATIRVLTQQFYLIFGIQFQRHSGFLNYFYTLVDAFKNFEQTNVAQLIMSFLFCTVIILVKKYINERYQLRLKAPIPIEFIMVVLLTVASHFGQFEKRFGVEIVKHIPQGAPTPAIPSLHGFQDFILDGTVLAFVSFVMLHLTAKLFSAKHNLSLHPNQDLFAMGICHVFGSFFFCIASSSSPPRSFLAESTGGHTQMMFLLPSILILFYIIFLAPVLESLPICILACLITVSCIPVFPHYKASITYWRSDKYDFAVYMITVAAMLLWEVYKGVLLGIAASIFIVVLRTQSPYTTTLWTTPDTGTLVDSNRYHLTKDIPGIRIFHFEAPLYFATEDIFKEKLYAATFGPNDPKPARQTGVRENGKFEDKRSKIRQLSEVGKQNATTSADTDTVTSGDQNTENQNVQNKPQRDEIEADESVQKDGKDKTIKVVVIDASCMPFVDTMGARLLASLEKEYKSRGITLLLGGCTETVNMSLHRVQECKDLVQKSVYPSAHEALKGAQTLLSI